MAYPSVTHSFSNGTTASATQVNQNFTDLINGFSDGTKDFSMNAGTLAGALTANGNVTLGNASSDDLTINASLASSLAIKTNNSYDLGAATLAPASIYLGAPSSRSTRLRAHQSLSGSNTLIFPNGNGNANQALVTDGSGNMSWAWSYGSYVSKSDNYTVLDTDGHGFIFMTVVAKTITLPTAADNTGRIITIVKDVSGNGVVTIKGEAAGETVDGITGTTGITLDFYKEAVKLICDGSIWRVLEWTLPNYEYTLTASGTNWTTYRAIGRISKSRDATPIWRLLFNINGELSAGATDFTLTVSNVTFKSTTGAFTAISVFNGANTGISAYAITNTSTMRGLAGSSDVSWNFSGHVELNAKPSIVV